MVLQPPSTEYCPKKNKVLSTKRGVIPTRVEPVYDLFYPEVIARSLPHMNEETNRQAKEHN